MKKQKPLYITSYHSNGDEPLGLIAAYSQELVDLLEIACLDPSVQLTVNPTYMKKDDGIEILSFCLSAKKIKVREANT